MDGFFSGEAGQPSRIEKSNLSKAESSRRSRDFIKDQSKSLHEQKECNLKLESIEKGKIKISKYQQQEIAYQNKDKDIFEDLDKKFCTTKYKDEDRFDIRSECNIGLYHNAFILDNDKLIIEEIYNRRFENNKTENNNGIKFYFSDAVFKQTLLFLEDAKKDLSQINLQKWISKIIINRETLNVAKYFFPAAKGPDGMIKGGSKTFKAGTDGFIALAGTPTGQSKFYLLAQHPKAFPGKEVTSITVIRHADSHIDIEYEFGSQWEQKEEASPNTSNTVVFGSRDSLE